MSASAVGLYSISVRCPSAPRFLAWAQARGIPFVHLRGGQRGFDLANQDIRTLDHWRRVAERTVPITGVTADTDLADLLSPNAEIRRTAHDEVQCLTEAAARLGARWLRVLARRVPEAAEPAEYLPALSQALPLLAELHHPGWLKAGPFEVVRSLTAADSGLRLLADTAQLQAALNGAGPEGAERLKHVVEHSDVLHLSSSGSELDAPSDAVATAAAASAHPLEVAVEWTGPDRTAEACLAQHRAASARWAENLRKTGRLS